MNEYLISHYSAIAGIGLVLASWLWSIGGRGNKIIRRLGSTAVIGSTIILTCLLMGRFSWWLLLCYPALTPACLGYGAETVDEKIFRRFLFALGNLLIGGLVCLVLGGNAWWVLFLHAWVGMGTIFFAIKNPVYAPAEEFWVSMLLFLGAIMYPFIV